MKKGVIASVLIAVLCIAASGCENAETSFGGKNEDFGNYIMIDRKGAVESRIVESFDEDYYMVDNLKAMINGSIADYKKLYPNAEIELKKCEESGNNEDSAKKVRVVMSFDSCESYSGFNMETLFAGTVQQAYESGYDLDMTLEAVSEKAKIRKISKKDLLGMGDKNIIIYENPFSEDNDDNTGINPTAIKCPGNVLYVTKGTVCTSKNTVEASADNTPCAVVFD